MKKWVSGFVVGSVLASVATAGAATLMVNDAGYIHFKFDGVQKSVPSGYTVLEYEGRTYVPARFVAEQFGANVGWEANTNTVTIDKIKQPAQSENSNSPSSGTTDTNKSYAVNVDVISGSMKMHISRVSLHNSYKSTQYQTPINAVVMEVEVENTSNAVMHWFPSQGTLVLNTKEQAEAGKSLSYSDSVGGTFMGKVIKKGNIVVAVESDLSKITNLDYKIDGPFDDRFLTVGNDTTASISLNSLVSNSSGGSATQKLETATDLQFYLKNNYSNLQTSIGDTWFTYNVYENNSITSAYDYWVQVKYDSTFFYDLQYSNKITQENRTKVKQELKDFQEKIGRDVVAKMPSKKLTGGYYDSWYRYPNLKMDLITRRYYSWSNYDGGFTGNYESTKPSNFRWYPLIDDTL
ncbi:copper amine oxidase N-terminal domain-containing protein [Tumebacillus permanentifrigoris]|uniref:Copper amine oxidase-like protein n=1 Tax=Tumebacillus permanentifrigoris TaxID=378543 RepID=A0A316D579_9BACL|nr:copper amine oxidase N-terminal domain-containing protein [Tumebacillus permanentifrigoris]PWK07477.1 copper amine oxidase-like protein [Tumebacillus permanentifrigoris]